MFKRLTSRLPVRPWVIKAILMALLVIALVAIAWNVDGLGLGSDLPHLGSEVLERSSKVLIAGLLLITASLVALMVVASLASPRYVRRVVTDDVSQNALARLIGAAVFAILTRMTVDDGYENSAKIFIVFIMALGVLAITVFGLLYWAVRVVQLGLFDSQLVKIEAAVLASLEWRRLAPGLGGVLHAGPTPPGKAVHATEFGYLQRIDVTALQRLAVEHHARIFVAVLPGAYVSPKVSLAQLVMDEGQHAVSDYTPIINAFTVGGGSAYDSDPRFGLGQLSGLASPTMAFFVVNPHVAVAVIDGLSRVLTRWARPLDAHEVPYFGCDRVAVPALSVADMLDAAFNYISRRNAGTIEVILCLQKALAALALLDEPLVREAAIRQARVALERGEKALARPADVERLRAASGFIGGG